jgi:hypothetical protein
MRGTDTKQSSVLCLMSPESLVPAQHPIRAIIRGRGAQGSQPGFRRNVCRDRSALDSAGAPLEGIALDGALHGSQRAAAREQLDYSMLFRWFFDMDMVEPASITVRSRETASDCWRTTSPRSSLI